MRTLVLPSFVVFAACGEVLTTRPNEPPDAAPPDAQADGGSLDGAGNGGTGGCDDDAPFALPERATDVSSPMDEFAVALSDDELTLYLASNRNAPQPDLFFAERSSRDVPFPQPIFLRGVNSTEGDSHPRISSGGRTLYFDRISSLDKERIYFASRTTPTAEFSTPAPVLGQNLDSTAGENGKPWIDASETTLYYSSNRLSDGGTERAIYRALRPSREATFGASELVDELHAPGAVDDFPVLTADELSVYFASNRARGGGGAVDSDIYVARRPSKTERFGPPRGIAALSTVGTVDRPGWISSDRCTLYFTSNREGSQGLDIWRARRR